jgi:hypothetical protein
MEREQRERGKQAKREETDGTTAGAGKASHAAGGARRTLGGGSYFLAMEGRWSPSIEGPRPAEDPGRHWKRVDSIWGFSFPCLCLLDDMIPILGQIQSVEGWIRRPLASRPSYLLNAGLDMTPPPDRSLMSDF